MTATQHDHQPKPEQLPASPAVEEVVPGILRMQLPIDFTGLGHVNMYALVGSDGVTLIDPGLPTHRSWASIKQRLGSAGFSIADVSAVIVTHSHADHFGGAGRLVQEAGGELVVHESFRVHWLPRTYPDAMNVADHADRPGGPEEEPSVRWGATDWGPSSFRPSPDQQLEIGATRTQLRLFPPPVPTRRLADGATLEAGDRTWQVLHTPGHAADHLCLLDQRDGVLVTGDHVLPAITPHVSGMEPSIGDPLADYLSSLKRVRDLPDVTLALPAHGHPFNNVCGRVEDIIAHHNDRLQRLTSLLEGGGQASVRELARGLFPRRFWGVMAESETYAHLEHLRNRAQVDRRRSNGILIYSPTTD